MSSNWQERVDSYFTLAAGEYSRKSDQGLWRIVRRWESQAIVDALALTPQHRLLEVGCGAGFYGLLLRPHLKEYTGIDSCSAMASESRHAGLAVENRSIEDLPCEEPFDRILAAGVLEFSANPLLLLQKIRAQLEGSGGRAVLLIPHGGLIGRLYRGWHERQGCPTLEIDSEQLMQWIAAARLKVIAQRRAGPLSRVLALVPV